MLIIVNPTFKVRLASFKKSTKLVPIKDKQKTTTSKAPFSSGVYEMSAAVTCALALTKSNETKECLSPFKPTDVSYF